MIEIHLKLRVGVVIPAHNEAEFITTVIHAARAVPEVDEILVVDDGSSDRTAEVAAKQGARVVSHEENLGKGAAMTTGCRSSRSDVLIYLDGDLQNVTPEKIRRMIEPFREGNPRLKEAMVCQS